LAVGVLLADRSRRSREKGRSQFVKDQLALYLVARVIVCKEMGQSITAKEPQENFLRDI